MEENKIINNEETDTVCEVTDEAEEKSGMSTGLAMLIGGGITVGAIALGKAGKKVWAKIKAKKDASKASEESTEKEDEDESED